MIKKYFFALIICFITTLSFGMDTSLPPDSSVTIVNKTAAAYLIEEGKTLYFEGRVKDAILKFRQASVKDPVTWKAPYWISRCHYEMDNYGYALKYANEAVLLNNNEVDKEVYDLLAGSYHRLGILDTAIINYELAIANLPKLRANELKLSLRLEQCKFAQAQFAAGKKLERVRLTGDVNSGYNDYCPVIYNNGKSMYFTSRRSNTKGGGMNPSDQQFFEDIYSAKWDAELKEWDSITNNLGKINSTGFESLTYISEDGMTAYITLNTDAAPEEKIKTKSSDICEVNWTTQGRWSAPKMIANKTINTSFFDGGATVTADGNTMYFVSEQNAEKSQSDIFVVERTGKKWGPAKALPQTVNTKGRETTPYITPDGRYLFYSSNGMVGMGDYDIYVVEKIGNEWSEPKNLGAKFNTVNNDTHFKIYDAIGKAYMSGLEIVGDKASMDIYEINITLEELLKGL